MSVMLIYYSCNHTSRESNGPMLRVKIQTFRPNPGPSSVNNECNVVVETVPFFLFLTLHIASSEERNFECKFGNVTIYLANDRMCNGQKDCPDGSDEDDGCGVFSSCVHAGLYAIVFVRRM